MEGGRDGGREGGKEGGREGGREGGKEGGGGRRVLHVQPSSCFQEHLCSLDVIVLAG